MKNITLMYVNMAEIMEMPKEGDIMLNKENKINTDIDFDSRGKVYGWMADAMKDAQARATTEKHILFYVEIRIGIGGIIGIDSVRYISFMEITPDGFYVYPWVKGSGQTDAFRDTIVNRRDLSVFIGNAYAALSVHTERVECEWGITMARKAWAEKNAKADYQKIVRIAKALKRAFDGEEVRRLEQELKDAKAVLEAKFAEAA